MPYTIKKAADSYKKIIIGGNSMLKIVGTENGKIQDEKVILTDEGKITGFGVFLIILDVLADIGIVFLFSRMIKKRRAKSKQTEKKKRG